MCLEITIIDDTVLEPEIETFEVNLSTEDPSVDIGPDTSVVTIVDNDCEPSSSNLFLISAALPVAV